MTIYTIISLLTALVSIIVAIISIYRFRGIKKEQVIVAEAGRISEIGDTYQPYIYMNPILSSDEEGNNIQRVIVHGRSLEPRGIYDRSQLYIQLINLEKDFSLQVKHDDILLIYLKDKNIYKLRIFDKHLDNDNILTYMYNPQTGERVDSSLPHRRESVVGVVTKILEIK